MRHYRAIPSCALSSTVSPRKSVFRLTRYQTLSFFQLFLSAFVSAVVYSAVFLALRGTLVTKGGMRLQLNAEQRWLGMSGPLEDYGHFVNVLSRRLLWYVNCLKLHKTYIHT